MNRRCLTLGAGVLACCMAAWGDATLFFDFEGAPGAVSTNPRSVDGGSFLRLRENNRSKQTPELAAEVPPALAARSRTSLRVNRGLAWLKPLGKGEVYRFAPDFSVNFWFRGDQAPDKAAFFGCFNKSWRFGYQPSNQRFYFQNLARAEKEFSAVVPFPGGSWHMLTLVGRPGELEFYLDGKNIGKRKIKQALADSPELFLGNAAAHDSGWFDGWIDEFSLWDQALKPAEIAALFQGGAVKAVRKKTVGQLKKAPGVLERIETQPLPADFKAFEPVRSLDLQRAVIVKAESGSFVGAEPALQGALKKHFGRDFEVMTAAAALKSGRPMILFGRSNSNMLLRRLDVNGQIEHVQKGYELRVLPQSLDWPGGVIFFGGRTPEEMLQAVTRLAEREKNPAALPFLIECAAFRAHQPDPVEVAKMVESMREHYRNPPDYIPNQSAIRLMRQPIGMFRLTGHPAYARALAEMQQIYLENYDRAINARGTPPSFTFHEFPWMVSLVENSPEFTAADRVRSAEIMRRAVENCMNYWEMRDPMANYEAGKQVYYTNHPIFASRSVWFGAEYLWRHYRYQPAEYWMRVSENALAGTAPHPLGPEDSASYQYICYRLFIIYAIGSGKFDAEFFNSPALKEYIRYCKAQFSHLGAPAGYGDNPPLGNPGGFPILGYAVDLFADPEAESLLSLIRRTTTNRTYDSLIAAMGVATDVPLRMSDETVGLSVFKMDPFRMEMRGAKAEKEAAFDKIFFRSGWDPAAEFLVLSGLSSAPHGHQDANALPLYIRGSHIWLVEGDYIRTQPEEHNTVALSVDGQAVRPGARDRAALARLNDAAALPDKQMAATASTLYDYGKAVDWRRSVAWTAKQGFWVIDDLTLTRDAELRAENRFRLLGDALELEGRQARFVQKKSGLADDPAEFFISEGAGAAQQLSSVYDHGHGGRNGYYADYQLAGPLTRVLTQRRSGRFRKGETVRFVNFLGNTAARVHELAPGAYAAATTDGVQVALTGPFRGEGIDFDGRSCFISGRGIVAFGVRSLKIGALTRSFAQPEDLVLQAEPGIAAVLSSLRQTLAARPAPAGGAETLPAAPALRIRQQIDFGAPLTALAALPASGFVGGAADGEVRAVDAAGKMLWQRKFSSAVTALGCVKTRGGRVLTLVGLAPQVKDGDAELVALDSAGKTLWQKKFGIYQMRSGTIRTIFPAQLSKAGEPAIIVGNSGWHYFAYTPEGRQLWKRQIYHGATAGAAGDLDGDGIDEVIAGAEYYYHQILGANGKVKYQFNTPPWNYSVAAIDVDGDGKKDALCGRSDGNVHWMALKGGSRAKPAKFPAGGIPVSIQPSSASGSTFVAAAANGALVWGNREFAPVRTLDVGEPLLGMAADRSGNLLAAGLYGGIFRVNAQGEVSGVTRLDYAPSALPPPQPVSDGNGFAAASGARLLLF